MLGLLCAIVAKIDLKCQTFFRCCKQIFLMLHKVFLDVSLASSRSYHLLTKNGDLDQMLHETSPNLLRGNFFLKISRIGC